MTGGYKDSHGKFHPIKNYRSKSKSSRKNRDEPFEVMEATLPTKKELIAMQRAPSSFRRRQIGIVTGGKALGTAQVVNIEKKKKGTTSIGTPNLSKGKGEKLLGGIKSLAKGNEEIETQQQVPQVNAPQISSGGGIVIDPRTGKLHSKSGVLVDGFRLQTLLQTREKSPSVIALALFGAPLVALRPEKQQIIKLIVRRNK